jgi:hypothetical protein
MESVSAMREKLVPLLRVAVVVFGLLVAGCGSAPEIHREHHPDLS